MERTQFWLKEGTVVGNRYCLEGVLGKGGYGITYQGTDTRLNLKVAIKEYYPVFWSSRYVEKGDHITIHRGMEEQYSKGMGRFLEEARLLAQLSGVTGVVRVTDYFEENNTAYLVMEFLDGKNLKEMTERFGGRIPPQVLLPVLSPAMFALKKIHEKDLIHRDLSPDNIMMLADGSVRLIDFGNARDTSDNKSMTMAMKEGFAAPEQYRSKGQGPYTDVYGMCATIYYCLTGKLPPQAMERLMGEELIRPSQMGVEIPQWQEDTILQGLELYIQKRIGTMDELLQRLYDPARIPERGEPEPEAIHTVPQEKPEFQDGVQWYVPAQPEEDAVAEEELPAYVEGMTVPLVRVTHPGEPAAEEAAAEEEPPVEQVLPEEDPVPLSEELTPDQPTEKLPPAPRERYFVPPRKPEPSPPPEQEDSLVARMQAFCARIFGGHE